MCSKTSKSVKISCDFSQTEQKVRSTSLHGIENKNLAECLSVKTEHYEVAIKTAESNATIIKARRLRSAKEKTREPYMVLAFSVCYLVYFVYCLARPEAANDDSTEKATFIGFSCFIFTTLLYKLILGGRDNGNKKLMKSYLIKLVDSKNCRAHLPEMNFFVMAIPVGFLGYSLFVVLHDPRRMIPLAGIILILAACTLASKSSRRINLRTVIVGLFLQIVCAVVVIYWPTGHAAIRWLSQKVATLLNFSRVGTAFVWHDAAFVKNNVVFTFLPVLPFFAAVVSGLYHLGWIQLVIGALARSVGKLLETTAAESTSCCGNILLAMTEAPMLIRPLLAHMTVSELHAVMAGGFSTIAGSTMGMFIMFGVDPSHLMAASFMAAPACLAISKLVWPETEKSKTTIKGAKKILLKCSNDKENKSKNLLDAINDGAASAVEVTCSVVVNIIAILSLLSTTDRLLGWLGNRIGLSPPLISEPLSIELFASFILWPVAFFIGVPAGDCWTVARLLGVKFSVNEFLAYLQMSEMTKQRSEYERYYCDYVYEKNTTNSALEPILLANGSHVLPALNKVLSGPLISHRAEAIATYALCGASNLAAVGIQVGGVGSFVPSKKHVLAQVIMSALMTATAVNLLNAAMAGFLLDYQEPDWEQMCTL